MNITIHEEGKPFKITVTEGNLKGRDLCMNRHGRDEFGDSPWARLSLPRRFTESVFDSVRAAWSSSSADVMWKGLSGSTPGTHWTVCSFTVSQYEEFSLLVEGDGASVDVNSERVVDQLRVLYQLLSLALLLNAEYISQSLFVYCTTGAAIGVVFYTAALVYWLMNRVDNNRKSIPLAVALGGGLSHIAVSFWHHCWLYVLGLYVSASIFGLCIATATSF